MEKILIKFLWFATAVVIYISVFRFHVAPLLIESATGLSTIQTFLWPFAYSVDFFIGTNMTTLVENL